MNFTPCKGIVVDVAEFYRVLHCDVGPEPMPYEMETELDDGSVRHPAVRPASP